MYMDLVRQVHVWLKPVYFSFGEVARSEKNTFHSRDRSDT